ncbi:hypothetical protein D3C85_1463380 [compost metagenome]
MFVGGAGNDVLVSGGGRDTFLFSGHFGQDQVQGFGADDRLVFMGVDGGTAQADFRQHLNQVGNDTVLHFGTDSVTLVGVSADSLGAAQVVIA